MQGTNHLSAADISDTDFEVEPESVSVPPRRGFIPRLASKPTLSEIWRAG